MIAIHVLDLNIWVYLEAEDKEIMVLGNIKVEKKFQEQVNGEQKKKKVEYAYAFILS